VNAASPGSWRQLVVALWADASLRKRTLAFVAAALVALILGFVLTDAAAAALAVRRFGYYFMAAAFGGWLFFFGRIGRAQIPVVTTLSWRRILPIAAVVGALLWVDLVSEPKGFKVTNDEYVLQATALDLHLRREPAVLVRAYEIDGAFTPLLAYADKRPFFFPFVLSLVHDLTGYRVANGFILNGALAGLNLLLVFVLARRIAGNAMAALGAVILWGGLPLFVQNANGSGMELLNVTMLALLMLLAWEYWRTPDETGAAALILTTVLLAQTRYESALFVPVSGIVVLAGWRRAGRPVLPWAAVAAPLLLLPYAWQNHFTNANRALWELQASQETRFGFEYLGKNLHEAARFYFAWRDRLIPNSWLLSVAGVAGGIAALVWAIRSRRTRPLRGPAWSLVLYALAVLLNLGLLLCYYWGQLSDPVAARLSLPSLMIATLAVAWLLGWLAQRGADARWFVGAAALYFIGVMRPVIATHYYTQFNPGPQQIEWEADFVRERPAMSRLIVTNKTVLPWIMQLQPAVMLKYTPNERDQLQFHLREGTFGEILVTQRLVPSTPDGGFVVDPVDRLPADFKLEPLAEKRFNVTIDRISRLVAVGDVAPEERAGDAPGAPAPQRASARSIERTSSPSEPSIAAWSSVASSR
jgi:hypothetical protein